MHVSLDPSRFQAALFDVDGTLVDSLHMILQGLADAIEHFDGFRPAEADLMKTIGTPLVMQHPMFAQRPLAEDELRERVAYTISRYRHHVHLERWFEPAIDALRAFQRSGRPVALVTSRNDEELQWFLERFPARDALAATVCASDVARPKPAPDPALLACEKLGVKPEDAIFVGDSTHDAHCAHAAGCAFAAVAYGAALPRDLATAPHDAWFESPEALRDWTNGLLAERHATI